MKVLIRSISENREREFSVVFRNFYTAGVRIALSNDVI